MNQSQNFAGQHLFGQILALSSKADLRKVFDRHKADRYFKRLKAWEHYVTMMYGVLANCTSLREIVLGVESFAGKLVHLNMGCIPARSTLSDGNKKEVQKYSKASTTTSMRSISPLSRTADCQNLFWTIVVRLNLIQK